VDGKTDSDLVKDILAGNGESFSTLCRRYYPAMVAVAQAVLADRHLAEDAAQQGFANACGKLSGLTKKHKFGSWLAAICRNAAIDIARRHNRIRYFEDFPTLEAKPETDDRDFSQIKQAIAKLKPADRELIFLRFYNEKSYDQISNVLGISIQAINGRLRRIKKKIAIQLNGNNFAEARK